jgi:hypothetical protein
MFLLLIVQRSLAVREEPGKDPTSCFPVYTHRQLCVPRCRYEGYRSDPSFQ